MGCCRNLVRFPRDPRGEPLCGDIAAGRDLRVFHLCFIYIALLSVNAAGIGLVIGVGTIVMLTLGRHEDILITGITTTVVLVVATIDPKHALAQPPLRLLDTIVGIGVGMLAKWAASYAVARAGIVPVSDNASRSTARQAGA